MLIQLFGFGIIRANKILFFPVSENKTQKINVKQNRHSGEVEHADENLADALGVLHAGVELRSCQFFIHFDLEYFPLAWIASKMIIIVLAAFVEREHDNFDQVGRHDVN